MKLLKYESFLETMQFAVLTNAQRLTKQEADRKAKQDKETPKTIDTNDDDDDYGQKGDLEMEPQAEGDLEMEPQVQAEGDLD